MNSNDHAIIGIVGGMGPHSGFALANHILKLTKASTDQDHLSMMVMSFPNKIVDRTLFLEGVHSVNPADEIVEIIRKLEKLEAEIIGIACNTAHCPEIFDVIKEKLKTLNSLVKVLHMPDETCNYIRSKYPNIKRVGLMTTNGMYNSGLYRRLLEKSGYVVILPDFKFQNEVIHKMVYESNFGIKSHSMPIKTEVKNLLKKTLKYFKNNNADAIILGCTEFSILLEKDSANGMTIIDSTKCLAGALIENALSGQN